MSKNINWTALDAALTEMHLHLVMDEQVHEEFALVASEVISESDDEDDDDGGDYTATDLLADYLDKIASRLVTTGMSEDEALDSIIATAARLMDEGRLDEMPSEDSDESDVASWLGQAQVLGFEQAVYDSAK